MDKQTEAIINSLDDAIVSVDEHQRIVLLNEAASRIFTCSSQDIVEQPISQFSRLAHAWSQLKVFELNLSVDSPRAVRRLELENCEGDVIPLEALVSHAVVGEKKIVTAVFRDISLQRQMEEAIHLARKHQAVGALASGIAHDFNNILTAIISQIDLVVHAPECPPSLKANLDYAQSSARRGAELVAKLQVFSRQAKPKLMPLNLREIVEQVVFVLRRSIDPRIEIHWSPPAEKSWPVMADTSQMMHALVNLGLNARDAMSEGGHLNFELANISIAPVEARPPKKAGEFTRLTVSDTGRGMSPEILARLFEPYFSTKDLSRGPGLGLSMTFSVICEHHGWIEADSRPGKGSCFLVYLPRTREIPVASAAPESEVISSKALEGRECVLVVDDEEAVRIVMRAILSYRGYRVIEASDGEEAVGKYLESATPIDLVLMDLHMPRTNGHDALMRIRERNPKAKAILLSGGLQEPDSDAELEIEGVRFLQKPFDNSQLVAAVRETLDGR